MNHNPISPTFSTHDEVTELREALARSQGNERLLTVQLQAARKAHENLLHDYITICQREQSLHDRIHTVERRAIEAEIDALLRTSELDRVIDDTHYLKGLAASGARVIQRLERQHAVSLALIEAGVSAAVAMKRTPLLEEEKARVLADTAALLAQEERVLEAYPTHRRHPDSSASPDLILPPKSHTYRERDPNPNADPFLVQYHSSPLSSPSCDASFLRLLSSPPQTPSPRNVKAPNPKLTKANGHQTPSNRFPSSSIPSSSMPSSGSPKVRRRKLTDYDGVLRSVLGPEEASMFIDEPDWTHLASNPSPESSRWSTRFV